MNKKCIKQIFLRIFAQKYEYLYVLGANGEVFRIKNARWRANSDSRVYQFPPTAGYSEKTKKCYRATGWWAGKYARYKRGYSDMRR